MGRISRSDVFKLRRLRRRKQRDDAQERTTTVVVRVVYVVLIACSVAAIGFWSTLRLLVYLKILAS